MEKTGKTTYAINEELHRRVFDLIGEGKAYSQREVADAIGYSGAVISSYRTKKYAGNIPELEAKLRSWLDREERRRERLDIPIVEINTMQRVRRAATIAHEERDIAVIVGDAGTGKTTALRRYVEESHSAYIVEVDTSFTKSSLVREIARVIDIDATGSMAQIIARIIETLRERDALLIIDEADYLPDSSLELVRRVVNDKARMGVVLCGLPRLLHRLKNLRNDHQQLASRVGVLLKVEEATEADARAIVGSVWPGVDEGAVESFIDTSRGSVRTLSKLMRRVHRTLIVNDMKRPTREVIGLAAELLMRPTAA